MAPVRQISAKRAVPPSQANAALAAFHAAVNVFQFLLLPLWLLPHNVLWSWVLLPLAALNNPFWSLIHEAIHDLFHAAPRVNILFGRLAGILFGAPFRILRLSHLLHHRFNRTPMEATELFDAAKCSRLRASSGYFFQILGGLYLVEVFSALLFFLPRRWLRSFTARYIKPQSVSGLLMQSWTTQEALKEIRTDGALVVGWLGLSFWSYGAYWPLLLAILVMRGFFISFLDNVYHYRTPVNDIFYASNLRLPAPLARLLLNFNLHGVHHQNPTIPWSRLPGLFREHGEIYHGNYFRAAARQLYGPVAISELPARPSPASLQSA
jgi:fatty acid desaturase